MSSIRQSFIVARPTGIRIRTRLRLTAADHAVVEAVGVHLGRLAGADLASRCRLGSVNEERATRKRALTSQSSSRWAGSITRTSNDQWERAVANLADRRLGLRRACRTIQMRLAVPVGHKQALVRGYATRAERFAKQSRLQHLLAELAGIERRLAADRMAVCRGSRRLAKLRHSLDRDDVQLTVAGWRARWQAERLFLTADGEAAKQWGNETIRVHPDRQWCEVKLPAPVADLANRPRGRYRLACPVRFTYRGQEWAAQAATGAVRYDITYDCSKARWYLDASWRRPMVQAPSLQELRQHRVLGVDLNADHLACWVLDPSGNPTGPPDTISLDLGGLPASTRDGHLRAAVAAVMALATASGCRSIIIEDLDFTDARQTSRESLGRGRRGKQFRTTVSGIPTRKFRTLLVGMAANHDLWVIAVDPRWTSKWGRRYWQAPLNLATKPSITVTGHHAAAVVIGRRGLGHRARRRPGVPGHDRRIVAGELPTRPVRDRSRSQGPGPSRGQRAAISPRKTRPADRSRLGDQVAQDRSGPPAAGHRPARSEGTVRRW